MPETAAVAPKHRKLAPGGLLTLLSQLQPDIGSSRHCRRRGCHQLPFRPRASRWSLLVALLAPRTLGAGRQGRSVSGRVLSGLEKWLALALVAMDVRLAQGSKRGRGMQEE